MALTDAQAALVTQLKRKIGTTDLSDDALYELLVAANPAFSTDSVAADLWTEKAAAYAELADVQEGSSKRSLSKLYEQSLKMADKFAGDLIIELPDTGLRRAQTRAIERA